MNRILLSLIAACGLLAVQAGEPAWMTDVPAAVAKAKAENKRVLLDFTGSDWCGWCIKLHKEVFSQKEFLDYADKNLVLVQVDFPQRKKQAAKLKKANEALSEKFKIEGYPTIVILNAEGKQVGSSFGYEPSPKEFISQLDKRK